MREPKPGGQGRRGGYSEEVKADEESFAALVEPVYGRVEDMPQYMDLAWDERAVVILRADGVDGPNTARRLHFTVVQANGILLKAVRRLGFTSVTAAAEALKWPSSERRLQHAASRRAPQLDRSPHILFRIGDRVHRHAGLDVEIGALVGVNTDMLLMSDGSEWARRRTHLGSKCQ